MHSFLLRFTNLREGREVSLGGDLVAVVAVGAAAVVVILVVFVAVVVVVNVVVGRHGL